ncbi:MAG TPA: hypothetical protein VNX28_17240, partial [Gemmataceae bacterium]|nr:hypothetical protein [Gemmataceae bacterium]
MQEWLALNRHSQARQVREIRRAQTTRFMHLPEEHFLGRPMLGPPLSHAPLHCPTRPLPVLARILLLQPLHQRLGLELRLTLQLFCQTWPDRGQRVQTCSPRVRGWT